MAMRRTRETSAGRDRPGNGGISRDESLVGVGRSSGVRPPCRPNITIQGLRSMDGREGSKVGKSGVRPPSMPNITIEGLRSMDGREGSKVGKSGVRPPT
jgi:hypothetical protein